MHSLRTSLVTALLASLIATGCSDAPGGELRADAAAADASELGSDSSEADAAITSSSMVEAITFNWPARYGPSPGVDVEDEALWATLSPRASVFALQEAGWIAGYLRNQDWEVHRPNPSGDGDDQPVGNFLVWNPEVWSAVELGSAPLSPRTRIQEEAAGPTFHRAKHVVWARLQSLEDGSEWVFASIHFVPSKHLGGAALALWEQQRDSLLAWWATESDRTLVLGDFNAQPGDAAAQPFWDVAQRQAVASHGNRKIDWIVRKPAVADEGVEALDHRGQSDHRPVRGAVRWSR